MQQRKKIMLKELGVFAAVNAPSCFIQLIGQINMKAPQFSLTAACNEEAARTIMHVLGHKARGCVYVLRCQKCTRRLLDFLRCASHTVLCV